MRAYLHTVIATLVLTVSVVAQDPPSTPEPAQIEDGCTDELFRKAQKSFELRQWGSTRLYIAERELQAVAWLCQERPAGYRAKELLNVVHEDMAETQLSISRFYLARVSGGKAGALSRLTTITEKYTTYSKMDQVLSLLGDTNMTIGNVDAATTYYQRLLKLYPGSQYVGDAALRLNTIELQRKP